VNGLTTLFKELQIDIPDLEDKVREALKDAQRLIEEIKEAERKLIKCLLKEK